jgi:hypothetical protein
VDEERCRQILRVIDEKWGVLKSIEQRAVGATTPG